MTAMGALDAALKTAEDTGTKIAFWWRDDDAVAPSPALDRLISLGNCYGLPQALAVIPAAFEPSLAPYIREHANVSVLVHGLNHHNYAPQGEKKAEFGPHRPIGTLAAEVEEALALMRDTFSDKLTPVFVPPWNRITADLLPRLATSGLTGLSTFGERTNTEAAPGLAWVNTHIDPIDWHGSRSVLDMDILSDKLARAILRRVRKETTEPIGLLTHHRVHDEAIWSYCERLIARLSEEACIYFSDIRCHLPHDSGEDI